MMILINNYLSNKIVNIIYKNVYVSEYNMVSLARL
ncbi:hypothetical protein J2S04_002540 [Alicyclobacillus tengchongensis]|uniref:Uncharacterized protein n=1 Tax=Alicyclobacillus tolerans TaxID=90970 RepID=A0ABT9LZ71_9BACL|nr:hypothetical protein [Alicyclobacillus tengchongensis]